MLIRCRVDIPYTTRVLQYHYRCSTVLQKHENPGPDWPAVSPLHITADIALQPVKKKFSLLLDGTIVRLPHGSQLPQQTWECKCTCILVSQTHQRACVLLLGKSSRVPGTYERVGLADAWPPSVFAKFEPRVYRIA